MVKLRKKAKRLKGMRARPSRIKVTRVVRMVPQKKMPLYLKRGVRMVPRKALETIPRLFKRSMRTLKRNRIRLVGIP